MRVASNDWCASRQGVSVTSSRFCSRTHWANRSGPNSWNRSRVPGGGEGDKETRRQGDKETEDESPALVSLSPCLLVSNFRVTIDNDFANVGQQLGGSVLAGEQLKQLGRFVEKARGETAS